MNTTTTRAAAIEQAAEWLLEMAGYAQSHVDADWRSANGVDFEDAISGMRAALAMPETQETPAHKNALEMLDRFIDAANEHPRGMSMMIDLLDSIDDD